MHTFRLTQNQIGKNLYLLPNANGCNIGLTPYPNTGEANWEDVDDPAYSPDDDLTYVFHDSSTVTHDLYSLVNHTTETGTINYVQAFTRAKSHLYALDPTATFKLLLDDSNCTDTQKSSNFNLVTTYSKYSHVWNTNPFTGVAFNWANIDDYQCGLECASPGTGSITKTLTIRPNGAGFWTGLSRHGDTTNWECVDDVTSDGDSTYVYNTNSAWFYDLYDLQNHTTEVGTITNVAVFIRCKSVNPSSDRVRVKMRIGGTNYEGSSIYASSYWAYTLYSKSWAGNPQSGVAWTWADIDNLQAGVEMMMSADGGAPRCTQVYVVVTYEEPTSPEIRATQCYMKVNYDETVYCDLNQPEEISQDYAQNIKMLNHWSGNRSVYGLSKSKDTTVLQGYEIEDSDCTDACARLKCVEELGKQGDPVDLTGLGYTDYDDEYQILSWGWKCISKKPVYYTWILELERTT